MRISQYKIPYIPPQVQPGDLQPNGKLFTDEEIREIEEVATEDGRYRLTRIKGWMTKLRYAVIAKQGECFAVYSGQHPLGEGSYGKVKLAQNLRTGEWHALKVQALTKAEKEHIKTEGDLLQKLGLIVEAGADFQPVKMERRSVRKARLQHYMLMRYSRGQDMFEIATNKAVRLSSARWIKLIISMLDALKELHDKQVLHRDIKLTNIIAELAEDEVSLVDFGLAAEADAEGKAQDTDVVGSPFYTAPELMSKARTRIYNEKSEIHALGVVVALMLDMAWEGHRHQGDETTLADKVDFYTPQELAAQTERPHRFKKAAREQIREYLIRMTDDNPAVRPTVAEARVFFKRMLSKINDRSLSVGLLDVNTFDKENDEMLDALQKYDYVWLVDKGLKCDPFIYARLRRELEMLGVRVGDRLYTGVDVDHLQKPLLEKLIRDGGDYLYRVENVWPSMLPDISRFGLFAHYFTRPESTRFEQKEVWPAARSSHLRAGISP